MKAGTRAGLAALAATVGLLLGATPAGAHAELVETEPAAGEQLDAAPEEVVLRFTESVTVADDGVTVLTSEAEAIDIGGSEHPDGERSSVAVALPDLEDDTYVVVWHVVSADSHPVSGAFTFTVGDAAALSEAETQSLVDEVLAGAGSDRAVGTAHGIVRFAAFAGVVVLVGGGAFVLGLWPAGERRQRVRRILAAAWWLAVGATLLSIPLQGAYAAGGSFADALDPSVIGDEFGARTGRAWLIRLALLAVAAVAWSRLPRALEPRSTAEGGQPNDQLPRQNPLGLALGVALGLGLLATVTSTGHATSGYLVPLAIATDLVHLTAVSSWLGGLVVLLGALLWRADDAEAGDDSPDKVVARFSRAAGVAVAVIAATGVVQGWRQVGSWNALVETNYGRLLLVKVGLVALILAAASVSRAWVRQRVNARAAQLALSPGPGAAPASGASRAPLSLLRQSVAAEVGLAVVVLATTALLVNAVPGRTAEAEGGGVFSETLSGELASVQVVVDPAEVGASEVHLYVTDPVGTPIAPEEVTASLTLPDRDIGPLDVPLVSITPDHYVSERTEIPLSGDWELEVVVRMSDIDQDRLATELPVP